MLCGITIPLLLGSFEISSCTCFYKSYFNIIRIKRIYRGILTWHASEILPLGGQKTTSRGLLVGGEEIDYNFDFKVKVSLTFLLLAYVWAACSCKKKFYIWLYFLKRVFGIKRLLNQGVHTQKYTNTQIPTQRHTLRGFTVRTLTTSIKCNQIVRAESSSASVIRIWSHKLHSWDEICEF